MPPRAQHCSLWSGTQPCRVVKAMRLVIPVQYKKQYVCSEKDRIRQQAMCCHSNANK